jgi:hypothetical protein
MFLAAAWAIACSSHNSSVVWTMPGESSRHGEKITMKSGRSVRWATSLQQDLNKRPKLGENSHGKWNTYGVKVTETLTLERLKKDFPIDWQAQRSHFVLSQASR